VKVRACEFLVETEVVRGLRDRNSKMGGDVTPIHGPVPEETKLNKFKALIRPPPTPVVSVLHNEAS